MPAILTLLWSGGLFAAETPVTLKLLNWADYIAPSVLQKFAQQEGIQVEVVPFDSDERKDELLLETNGGEGLDLVLGQGHSLKRLLDHGWLIRLDDSALPHRASLLPEFDGRDNGVHDFAVSYLWGTLGIAYREDKVPNPPKQWKDLFTPLDARLRKRILMFNDSREAFGMALIASGHSANSIDEHALQDARNLLNAQRPFAGKYGYPALDKTSELLGNEFFMAAVYSGDALTLMALDKRIRFVVPEEGSVMCVDYIGILKKSRHPNEAMRFLDFISRPDIAAENAEALGFAPTNGEAQKRLSESFRQNKIIFPADGPSFRLERYKILTPAQQKRRAELFIDATR